MADGLFQWVRLRLDRQSAEEVRDGAKDALQDGTDPKNAERNLDRVESRFQRVRRAAVALGAAIAAAFTVRAIGGFIRDSFRAAEELRTSRVRLAQALRNEGIEWENVEGQIQATTRALWDSHRLTEGEVTPTLQALITITGDYEASLRGVGIAADLAAATNMDVQSAARLVGRVMNGETAALNRYGISIEEGADAMAVLEERLQGMALAATPATVQLTKAWGDLKEAIGEVLIVGGDTDSMIGGMVDRIRELTDDINENQERLAQWVAGVSSGFATVGRAVLWVVNGVRMAAEAIGAIFGTLTVQLPIMVRRAMVEVEAAVLRSVENLARPLRMLGITIGEEFMDNAIAGVRSRREALQRELESARNAFADVLADIGSPLRSGSGSPTGDDGPVPGAVTGGGGPGGSGGPGGIADPEVNLREIGEGWANELGDGFGRFPIVVGNVLEEAGHELELFDARFHRTARSIERGFEPFFGALYQGFGDTAALMDGFVESVQGVGAAVIGALAEGQVEYHRAQGIAKLAEGTWPPNPAAIAASLQHFAAAAAFAALPGIVGSVGGGGTGGAGSIRSARSPDRPRMGAGPIGPDIVIRIDGVDPKNPRHQALVGETSRQYQQRYGGRIRVED